MSNEILYRIECPENYAGATFAGGFDANIIDKDGFPIFNLCWEPGSIEINDVIWGSGGFVAKADVAIEICQSIPNLHPRPIKMVENIITRKLKRGELYIELPYSGPELLSIFVDLELSPLKFNPPIKMDQSNIPNLNDWAGMEKKIINYNIDTGNYFFRKLQREPGLGIIFESSQFSGPQIFMAKNISYIMCNHRAIKIMQGISPAGFEFLEIGEVINLDESADQ